MWALVFVYMYDEIPYVEFVSKHTNMYECFYAREDLSSDVGKGGGYFNLGQQAICIQLDERKI